MTTLCYWLYDGDRFHCRWQNYCWRLFSCWWFLSVLNRSSTSRTRLQHLSCPTPISDVALLILSCYEYFDNLTRELRIQALLAQWIARWTSNPKVVGSSPTQGNLLSVKVNCLLNWDFWWRFIGFSVCLLIFHSTTDWCIFHKLTDI